MPVAIRGTIDILPRGTRVMHTGKRVDVTIGAPLVTGARSLDELMAEVAAFFKQHVER